MNQISTIEERFGRMATDNAPGQEVRQGVDDAQVQMRGEELPGRHVDFSHGDVDAFAPAPGAEDAFLEALSIGGAQAYTEYRGSQPIREGLATRLGEYTGSTLDPDAMILTPGTQGALFLAVASLVGPGDRIAIADPDYFANRKIPIFLGAQITRIRLDHHNSKDAGLDLGALEQAFRDGVRVFLFSNPNNPTGVVYSADEIASIGRLAAQYGAAVICDQLYSRLLYSGESYHHLCAHPGASANMITIMGPSKTESLSGYRLGVAFGAPHLIERMDKLQAIVSLRAAGYSQRVLNSWFSEPAGWMDDRISQHEAIRDDLLAILHKVPDVKVRTPQAGSYLFPELPPLDMSLHNFVKLLRTQAGVIVTPGDEFTAEPTMGVRFNFSQDHAAAVDAMHRVAEMVQRYRASN